MLTIAHLLRAFRWELFIKVYERPNKRLLLQSLSAGYLISYIVPFKLGDIARAWIPGNKMKNGKALSFSTVIVDRFLDIICVGVIFAFLYFRGIGGVDAEQNSVFYVIVAVVMVAVLLLIYCFRGVVKRLIKFVASIFNQRIESIILRLSWALIWNVKDIFLKISKAKLFAYTLLMWLGYLSSYYLFAKSISSLGIDTRWSDIFIQLFTQNGIKESTGTNFLGNGRVSEQQPFMAIVYQVVPLLLLIVLSLIFSNTNEKTEADENYLNLIPQLDPNERRVFLESYFSNKNREYVDNYLKINQGISIIRDFSAGSNATTMLCLDGKRTFFRKYAFGEDGEKLYQQIKWIKDNKDKIVLPEIISSEKTEQYCYYDMPYEASAVGLFEYTHSMPIEKSWHIIESALSSLEKSIYRIDAKEADKTTIDEYIDSKVLKNIKRIKEAKYIKQLLDYDKIIINGVEYNNFAYFEKYLSKSRLEKVFANDTYAVIHGDLTIENIICTRDESGKDNFYIIDPNTGNIHNSPNLDYGKLLQSIHGGYEFLMATKDVKVKGNTINFLFTKSSAYKEIHSRLRKYMEAEFGAERTRSIYFHEIIHWLRLMPYKIEKDGIRSLLFYAGMIIVMNDVINMYGETLDE